MLDNETAGGREDTSAPRELPEVVRSEEVLRVSTRTVPLSRVRMQKVIVTETQT